MIRNYPAGIDGLDEQVHRVLKVRRVHAKGECASAKGRAVTFIAEEGGNRTIAVRDIAGIR